MNHNNIEGKIIVITGASSGLGEAAARHLSALGATVVLGARRIERLKALADDLTRQGRKALVVETDVTRRDQVERLVDAAVDTYGRVDVMINNAGLMPHSPLDRLKVDSFARAVAFAIEQPDDVDINEILYRPTRQIQ